MVWPGTDIVQPALSELGTCLASHPSIHLALHPSPNDNWAVVLCLGFAFPSFGCCYLIKIVNALSVAPPCKIMTGVLREVVCGSGVKILVWVACKHILLHNLQIPFSSHILGTRISKERCIDLRNHVRTMYVRFCSFVCDASRTVLRAFRKSSNPHRFRH